MNSNKGLLLFSGVIVAIIVLVIAYQYSDNGSWIRDSRGLWIKDGSPRSVPEAVVEQQILLLAAQALYQEANGSNINLAYGPCLGLIGDDWVVDIAHVPRESYDEDSDNQCPEYQNGTASHFIELDPDGNLLRIK
ncbi:hypothetical protein ACFL04_02000 [Patescibacteria group bacterium]